MPVEQSEKKKREKKSTAEDKMKMRSQNELEVLHLVVSENSWLKNKVMRHIEKHLGKKPKIS
ncbi:MAG: hypothetical protein K2X39_02180 [Silvanigrellaceae bacterium]|nr:hypothetical protein [Silvanigrellaceae bacterium]